MFSKGEKKTNLKYSAVKVIFLSMLAAILYLQFQVYTLGTRMNDFSSDSSTGIVLASNNTDMPLNDSLDENESEDSIELQKISESVCLIQGEYVFIDTIGKHVSWQDVKNVIYAASSSDANDQDSQTITIQYTGSGFLADYKGHIVTNKHVAMPWIEKSRDRELIKSGFSPKLVMFRAFFPGIKTPFDIEVAMVSENDDLAILKFKAASGYSFRPLSLCNSNNEVVMGDPVIVLGYPTGFDLLSASIDNNPTSLVFEDFAGLGLALSDSHLIYPMATRGICGQIYPGRVAYDALTAIGASGSPVLNSRGEVIAVNTALLKGFAGTNFGIPVGKVENLLTEVKLSK